MPSHRNVTRLFVQESDEEFARAVGIILPEAEPETEDIEVEDVPMEGNVDGGDPWSDLHRAA